MMTITHSLRTMCLTPLRANDQSYVIRAEISHNPAFRAIIGAVHSARHCERSEAIQDGGAELDCFVAEPVIGPATSGRTRWLLAMTNGGTEPNDDSRYRREPCRGIPNTTTPCKSG